MIRHIVLFKLLDIKSEEEKSEKTNRIIQCFGNLKSSISTIQHLEVKRNEGNNPAAYDIGIYAEYASWKDLDSYSQHPAHQQAIKHCKQIAKEKAVIDYEIE